MKLGKRYISSAVALALLATTFSPVQAMAGVDVERSAASTIAERLKLERSDVEAAALEREWKLSEDEIVIQSSQTLSQQAHRGAGGRVIRSIPDLGYQVVKLDGSKTMQEALTHYAGLEQVKSARPSVPVKKLETDPKVDDMYHLGQLDIANARSLAGDNNVRVAVIDGGVNSDHPDLSDRVVSDYFTLNPIQRATKDAHGTHVAGIIAAEMDNGIGGEGINPNADIISIDVFGRSGMATDYTIAEGILKAIEEDAQVINMSLGSPFRSDIIGAAVTEALDAGITIVAAAGNELSNDPFYPAAEPGVISVGATDADKEKAWFTSYGPHVDIVAPGDSVYSTLHDMDKPYTYGPMSGTSMSSPVVAGVVSLMLSKNPDLTPYEIRYILQQTADDLGATGYDTDFGFGLVDPTAALSFNGTIPDEPVYGENRLEDSTNVTLSPGQFETRSGSIDVPMQEYRYHIPMEAGEYLQVQLEGSELNDLAFDITELTGFKDETQTVDFAREGEEEGYLFYSEEDQSVVVTVYDAYGKYNLNGDSSFSVLFEKVTELPQDGGTAEEPVAIDAFPYEVNEFTLAGVGGEQDYFAFTADSENAVEVHLDGVPGLRPSVSVYFADDFTLPEGVPEEELEFYEPFPFVQASAESVGDDVTLTFEAIPGVDYVLEVSSVGYDDWWYDDFFWEIVGDMFDFDMSNQADSSLIPYSMQVDAATLPEDEDGYPFGNFDDDMDWDMEDEFDGDFARAFAERKDKRIKRAEETFDEWSMASMFDEFLEAARPFDGDFSGFLQYEGDIDVAVITPEETGVYEFTYNRTKTLNPLIEVIRYNEDSEDIELVGASMSGSIFDYYNLPTGDEDSFYAGLMEGETYVMLLGEMDYGMSLDEYSVTSELVATDIIDSHGDNHSFSNATRLGEFPLRANMALSGMDYFYVSPKQTGLHAIHVGPSTKRPAQKDVPSELMDPVLPIIAVIEDTNGNGKLDGDESMRYMEFYPEEYFQESLQGSFEARAGNGYFVIVMNDMFFAGAGPKLSEYFIQVAPITNELRGTLPLVKTGDATWATRGFFPLINRGKQAQSYTFTVSTAGKVDVSLGVPMGADGVLRLKNSSGQVVATSDHYGRGDDEFLTADVAPGTYTVEVEEFFGSTAMHAFTLDVKKR
ncbi:S8 family serine peptidase [Paenalkalicoccus suaedae]|uniref:S8 family serine peptidase n=1 Tax=Paenalkalicoccus suaedae TaxID=2592382 RepID=A0A859FI98_9BACI|nr:S8 family serine peptidase [Paenalkalicoccus suaedae]QKS72392.1 S8 family serine peptidase [Paenalkalicoccus suaedae]